MQMHYDIRNPVDQLNLMTALWNYGVEHEFNPTVRLVLQFVGLRTIRYGKHSEMVPERHFLEGVTSAGERIVEGIGVSRASFYRAVKELVSDGIIQRTKGRVRLVMANLKQPKRLKRVATPAREEGWDEPGFETGKGSQFETSAPEKGLKLRRLYKEQKKDKRTKEKNVAPRPSTADEALARVQDAEEAIARAGAVSMRSAREVLDKASGRQAERLLGFEMLYGRKPTMYNLGRYWNAKLQSLYGPSGAEEWTKKDAGRMKRYVLPKVGGGQDDPDAMMAFINFVAENWNALVQSQQFPVGRKNAPHTPRIDFVIRFLSDFQKAWADPELYLGARFVAKEELEDGHAIVHKISSLMKDGLTLDEAREIAVRDFQRDMIDEALRQADMLHDDEAFKGMSAIEQYRFLEQRRKAKRRDEGEKARDSLMKKLRLNI